MKKRLLIAILVIILTFTLFGCVEKDAKGTEKVIKPSILHSRIYPEYHFTIKTPFDFAEIDIEKIHKGDEVDMYSYEMVSIYGDMLKGDEIRYVFKPYYDFTKIEEQYGGKKIDVEYRIKYFIRDGNGYIAKQKIYIFRIKQEINNAK